VITTLNAGDDDEATEVFWEFPLESVVEDKLYTNSVKFRVGAGVDSGTIFSVLFLVEVFVGDSDTPALTFVDDSADFIVK
jgi:hypothetical protein